MKKLLMVAVAGMLLSVSAHAGEVIGTAGEDQYTFGNLGVNTAFPARPLSLKADADNGKVLSVIRSTATAEIFSVSSLAHGGRFNMATSSNNEVIQLNTAGTSFITGSNLGIGTKTPTARLDVDTTLKVGTTATIGTTMSAAVVEIRGQGNDLAETFKVNSLGVEPGMVVSLDPKNPGEMMLCNEANDRKVAGIISGAGDLYAGIHLGDAPVLANGEHAVALTGRVWCHVDTALTGPVNVGDSLTTSPTPGHAMKVMNFTTAQGAIIGKAMSGLSSGKGLVLVLVNLH